MPRRVRPHSEPVSDTSDMMLTDLTHDPQNARSHTPRNLDTIVNSLNEVGAARSIVVDEDGVILAGNATVDAAMRAGMTRVRVVETDGRTIVAVRRSGLSDREKRRLALADNRAAELAEWDIDVLRGVHEDILDGLWTEDEIRKMFAEPGSPDDLDASPQLGGIEYRVIIDCRTEQEQAALLSELEARGLSVKAMMS